MAVRRVVRWRSSDSDYEFEEMVFDKQGDNISVDVSYQNENENIYDEINLMISNEDFRKLLGRLETEFGNNDGR